MYVSTYVFAKIMKSIGWAASDYSESSYLLSFLLPLCERDKSIGILSMVNSDAVLRVQERKERCVL